jgi:phospholipid/cholesterol/gamma-HCH transport system permease protein
MAPRRDRTPARPTLSAMDGALVVRLAGAWRVADGVPPVEPLGAALADGKAKRLAFDAEALGPWDMALVSYCLAAVRTARAAGAETDDSGLPEGARRLLALALATDARGENRAGKAGPGPLARLGLAAQGAWEELVATLGFLGELTLSVGRLMRGQARFRVSDFVETLRETGFDALPVVSLIAFLVGAILAFVGAIQLRAFGAQLFVADLVGVAMARDMGAIMTAIIVAGRTGAAFAARLGTMQGAEEIDALKVMALDPVDYLVLPRVMALVLMMPLLVIYANLMGILGGALVGANLPDVSLTQYLARTAEAVRLSDFAGGVFKGTIYGALVALAGCMRGMQCGRSAAAVGAATTSAGVTGIVYVIAAAATLTMVFHVLDI